MKKTLAILLLALLVVGCGSKDIQTESASEKEPSAQTDLSASLSGKRVHLKIDGESGWTEFHPDGTCYQGRGDERLPTKGQWSVSGNRLKVWVRNDDDYLVFTDLTARPDSEVIFLASADKLESEGPKGTILRVEPIPSGPQPPATEALFPITGTITYDGQPLADARIRLQSLDNTATRVYACDSKGDGTFEIEAAYIDGTKLGAPAGTYKVLVGKFVLTEEGDPDADEALELELVEAQPEGGSVLDEFGVKSVINDKFNNSSTTPLQLEVKAGKNSFRIDLKSNGTGTVKAR